MQMAKTPVAAGDSYNAGKTYYHATYNNTEVWKDQPVAGILISAMLT